MDRFIRAIEFVSIRTGEAIKWIAVAIVCLGTFEVLMRYVFNSPTQWGYESLLMMGASMYVLSWGYIQEQGAHLRIDILYTHLPPRGKQIVDIVGTIVFFLPVMGVLNYMSFARMWRAWAIGERSIDTTWYPPLGPLRTAVFLGMLLFTLQAIAQLVQNIRRLVED
jgi:TRAP-type mannitol/chloroaromatic compound transport system permease small subunit